MEGCHTFFYNGQSYIFGLTKKFRESMLWLAHRYITDAECHGPFIYLEIKIQSLTYQKDAWLGQALLFPMAH